MLTARGCGSPRILSHSTTKWKQSSVFRRQVGTMSPQSRNKRDSRRLPPHINTSSDAQTQLAIESEHDLKSFKSTGMARLLALRKIGVDKPGNSPRSDSTLTTQVRRQRPGLTKSMPKQKTSSTHTPPEQTVSTLSSLPKRNSSRTSQRRWSSPSNSDMDDNFDFERYKVDFPKGGSV